MRMVFSISTKAGDSTIAGGVVSRSVIRSDGMLSPDVLLSGWADNKKWCLRALLRAGRVGMDGRWPGKAFQIYPARLRPIPIFYGTPNFPIFFNQTINSSPYQTSMATTNMFEPGWILIDFIEDRLGDPKQFDPAWLKPNPVFYGTPNFPIIIVQTLNTSSSQTSMAATNMFEPGWILIISLKIV